MKWYNHIFLSVVLIVLFSLTDVVVAVISSLILRLDMVVLKTGIYVFVGMLLSKLLTFVVIAIIGYGQHKLPFKQAKLLWVFIGFVLFTSVMTGFVVLDYMYMIVGQPVKQSITILAVLLLLLMNTLLFYVIDKISEHFEMQHKLDTAHQLIEGQKSSYQNLFDSQNEVRKIRHDLKNTVFGILYQLENGQTEQAIHHLKENLKLLEANQELVFSGNSIIDTLLENKQKAASQENIQLHTDINLQEHLRIDAIDLAVLLGNALDNAIEATTLVTTKPKIIQVSIVYKHDNLLIVITNPVNTMVDVAQLKTTKPDKEHHGFGILQMKHLANKYNGDVFFDCTEERFKTSIIVSN